MSENLVGNTGLTLSNAIADAVARGGSVTALVDARRRFPASGIVYRADLVLAADHTIERDSDIRVALPDGSETSATVAGRDRGTDLALLRLSSPTATPPAQAAVGEARVGHLALAVGLPLPEGVQATLGMVNAIGGGLRTRRGALLERYLVTDATPLPGFSGGPLVDLAGGVLGINTSGLVRGASLAIPIQAAFQAAAVLAEHGRIRRGYLGIRSQVVEIPAQAADAVSQASGWAAAQAAGVMSGGRATGLLVVGVEAGGPAEAGSGLMVGDILVGLNGQPVQDHDDLVTALAGDVVGRTVEVQVVRGGSLQTVQAPVGERE